MEATAERGRTETQKIPPYHSPKILGLCHPHRTPLPHLSEPILHLHRQAREGAAQLFTSPAPDESVKAYGPSFPHRLSKVRSNCAFGEVKRRIRGRNTVLFPVTGGH